jgi:2'-5' RNA ligase
MRLFVAVNPGERFRQLLATQLDAWRSQLQIAWARPQTWHLTLDFLGEVPAGKVEPLKGSLLAECRRHRPLTIRPGEPGAFPNLNRPRVFFLQMDDDGGLNALAAAVRERVDEVLPDGEQDRKPFRPHLTIARIKRPLPRHQLQLLSGIRFAPWEPLVLKQVHLIASVLHPAGARHTDLAAFPLQGGA